MVHLWAGRCTQSVTSCAVRPDRGLHTGSRRTIPFATICLFAVTTLSGHLLIASPELRDPNFAQSVVLILRDDQDGSFGLVLNRLTNVTMRQAWKKVASSTCKSKEPLRLGGPVQGPLMALHSDPAISELEPVPGIHFVADPDHIRALVDSTAPDLRFYVGFSGWGPGQLEGELDQGAWLTLPAVADHVFGPTDDLWRRASRQVADRRMAEALNIRHIPPDPRLN